MTQRDNILQELNGTEQRAVLVKNPVNVYTVPSGYFEGLLAEVMKRIKIEADNAADELSHLSPFLNTISKQNPYTVPAGYFEELGGQLVRNNAITG